MDITNIKPPTKRTGFSVFNFFYATHAQFSRRNLNLSLVSKEAKLKFNARIHHLRATYNFSSEEMRGLIIYMYTHNPLGLADVSNYGNVKMLVAVAPLFSRWLKQNVDVIGNTSNLLDAIYLTKPLKDSSYSDLDALLNEIQASMERSLK